MAAIFVFLIFTLATFLHPLQLLAIQGDCPLDLSWSNFTSATGACSDPNDRGRCCRYINAFVAVSIAHYANSTGKLGVPSAFSDVCLDTMSKTLEFYGIPPNATVLCGLGTKIQVSYQCEGRENVLEMLQSSGFSDVVGNCKLPFSSDNGCKSCLNSGIIYLHHLIGPEDNITLSICRDAAFVTLANQGDNATAIDLATCFFGVQGLSVVPDIPSQLVAPTAPPSPVAAQAPTIQLISIPQNKQHYNHRLRISVVLGVGVVVVAAFVLMLAILIFLIRRKTQELKYSDAPFDRRTFLSHQQDHKRHEGSSPMFKKFSYKEIEKATNKFSAVIGRGGFGTVYKAQFSDGSAAAVKRMDKISRQGDDEFCREMELLGRLHHRHLVRLKGFCVKKDERFLIYEYMEKGSLKDHLHSPGKSPLSWHSRLQIAIDIANALEYLHFYCDPPLCHRDIKSSNILLDENFTAKVADFGLAHASRSGTISFEPVNTDIRGTPGYMDPEYMVTHELTEKSDIYSYGVLLLELVTGRRAIQDKKNLVEWSQKYIISNSMIPELVDPAIRDSFDLEQLQVLVEIIQWCTQKEGQSRPSIKQILRMFTERLDACGYGFSHGLDDDGVSIRGRPSRARSYRNQAIPHSGDARGLRSSSSTSRSYCSQSVLLESGSPQSPPGMFSV